MTITHIIGIDPGLSGAIALIQADTGELFDVTDMPTSTVTNAKGKKSRTLDADGVVETILDYLNHADDPEWVAIVIEKQSTRPGLSATSVFTTGTGYGVLLGIAAASCCGVKTIRPQEWKQWHPGLIGAGGDLKGHKRTAAIKLASREKAMGRFIHHADLFKRAKDDGRAEAALIADAYLRSLVARPVAA
jgi:crossover junction endodeoxyribonuclease RuvC